MCSIAGIVVHQPHPPVLQPLTRMLDAQAHRGPDDSGTWIEGVGPCRVALANTRLSILDLSPAGHQPMVSACGTHVLVYNGELYNFVELRQELQSLDRPFHTQCDTEVVLQALIAWGEQAVQRFNGMWAFAWLDRQARRLWLCRDRFGIKPLYSYRTESKLYFASEIKAILAGTRQRFGVDAAVVSRYVQHSLLDAQPQTFFSGIQALPPGHMVCFELNGKALTLASPQRYWEAPRQPDASATLSEVQRIDAVRETFLDSVRLRLRSDVPVGVLLSGGIDSSSIAAAMHKILGPDADLHLISAVGNDPRYSEQPFIDRMSAYLGCPTHKVRFDVGRGEMLGLLQTVTYANDEPVGGLGSVAHYMLMRQASALGITVILSGQGADELLCGYLKYLGFYVQGLIKAGRLVEATQVLGGFLARQTVLPQVRLRELKRYVPRRLRPRIVDVRGPLLREIQDSIQIGLNGSGAVERQYLDVSTFSVPALVHSEDRMSMAASREIRLPFLDYRLVSLLLPLAAQDKLRNGWTKWIFRRAMEGWLPPEIAWRKDKRHFITPEEEWFKHELRGDVEAVLVGEMLTANMGLVDQAALRRLYALYCKQPADGGVIGLRDVFNPIALEIWARVFNSSLRLDC